MSAGGPGVWSPLHCQRGHGGLGGDPETRRDPDPAVGQAHAPPTGLIRGAAESGSVQKGLQPVSRVGDSQPVMRGWAARATLGRGMPTPPHQAAGARQRASQARAALPHTPALALGTYRGLTGALLGRGCAGHLGDDGRHVGGAVELDPGQAVLVGLYHTLDPCGGRGVSTAPAHPHPGPFTLLPSHSSSSGLKLMAKSWDTWAEGTGQRVHLLAPPPPPQLR